MKVCLGVNALHVGTTVCVCGGLRLKHHHMMCSTHLLYYRDNEDVA